MTTETFLQGDIVTPINTNGYSLTDGSEYLVIDYIPQYVTDHFIWPAYVVFKDDLGKQATAHASRFIKVT